MTERITKKAAAEAERQESIDYLRELLRPGSEVYTILRHCSKSGMTRHISLMTIVDGDLRDISWRAARVLSDRIARDGGIVVTGCGMDMGFSLVYNLGRYLWPKGFDLPGGARGRNGDQSGHDNDGGYALRQRWL